MNYDRNVYYSPEKWGLTVVGMISDPNASYSFDDLVVWQHEDGRLFYASSAGCSCPTPFEEYDTLEELHALTIETYDEFVKDVTQHALPYQYQDESPREDEAAADKVQLLAKVWIKLERQVSKPDSQWWEDPPPAPWWPEDDYIPEPSYDPEAFKSDKPVRRARKVGMNKPSE